MKNVQKILTAMASIGTISMGTFNSLPVQAKFNEGEKISQTQNEPTPRQDLDRYGRKINRTFQNFKKNIGERYLDHILWKAEKCKITHSKTQNCQNAIKKARELNK